MLNYQVFCVRIFARNGGGSMGVAEKIQQAKIERIKRQKRRDRITLLILLSALLSMCVGLFFGFKVIKEYMDEQRAEEANTETDHSPPERHTAQFTVRHTARDLLHLLLIVADNRIIHHIPNASLAHQVCRAFPREGTALRRAKRRQGMT